MWWMKVPIFLDFFPCCVGIDENTKVFSVLYTPWHNISVANLAVSTLEIALGSSAAAPLTDVRYKLTAYLSYSKKPLI